MKKLLSFCFTLTLFAFAACEKEDKGSQMVLTGFDLSSSPCSGGVKVEGLISNGFNPPFYQWQEGYSKYGITDTTKFPLLGKIEFEIIKEKCSVSIGVIKVTSFQRL